MEGQLSFYIITKYQSKMAKLEARYCVQASIQAAPILEL